MTRYVDRVPSQADVSAEQVLEFCETVNTLTDAEQIIAATFKAIGAFGYEYATCAMVPLPGQSPLGGILLNNRPLDYLERYEAKGYAEKDPVVIELQHTLRPYSWQDVKERRDLTKAQLEIMGEASEFGCNNGLIIPIVTQSGAVSIFAPCGRAPDTSSRARSAVEIIGIAAHQALRRASIPTFKAPHRLLTAREREVMRWVAIGKTDDEISIILSIRPLTVLQHVENAKQKLNATKRTQAVVEALRLGEISF